MIQLLSVISNFSYVTVGDSAKLS